MLGLTLIMKNSNSILKIKNKKKYSKESQLAVLMTVYSKDIPERLSLALDGLVLQTYKDFNLYIVIDGYIDTDLSSIIAKFENHLKIVKLQLKFNIGAGPARNYGLSLIPEKIVAINDSDDVSLPTRLNDQLDFLISNKADIVSSNMNIVDENNIIYGERKIICNKFLNKDFLYKCEVNNPAVMFFRESVINIGYGSGSKSEDYHLWVESALLNKKIINLEKNCVNYYQPQNSYYKRVGFEYFIGDFYAKYKCLSFYNYYKRIFLIFIILGISSVRLLPSSVFGIIYTYFRVKFVK